MANTCTKYIKSHYNLVNEFKYSGMVLVLYVCVCVCACVSQLDLLAPCKHFLRFELLRAVEILEFILLI